MTNIKNKNNAIEQWLDINNNLKESLSGMASILIIEKILITDVLIEVEEEIKGLKKLISKQNNNNELQD